MKYITLIILALATGPLAEAQGADISDAVYSSGGGHWIQVISTTSKDDCESKRTVVLQTLGKTGKVIVANPACKAPSGSDYWTAVVKFF